MNLESLSVLITQAGSFISAFAAVAAGLIMANVTKKFGTGILASGFKSISIGVFFIAAGIFIDAIQSYLLRSANLTIVTTVIIAKELLFVVGTYVIVIGSKKTVDKLETLTK
jgi:hypothetical protein